MDRVLTDFVKALRNANIQVSPAETMDAVQVINAVGYSNKELLKQSLSIALPKTVEEKNEFYLCFDKFFNAESPQINQKKVSSSTSSLLTHLESDLAKHLQEDSQAEIMLAIEQAAEKAEIREIKYFTQRSVFTRRILEAMGVESLEDEIRQLGSMNESNLPSGLEQKMRSHLTNLREIYLFGNKIGAEGSKAITSSLVSQSPTFNGYPSNTGLSPSLYSVISVMSFLTNSFTTTGAGHT